MDETQLGVTELATNVVKHVGAGVSSTLVLQPGAGRLRIEMHDTSPVLPVLKQAACGEECGRGLHLLAVLAMDWGTVVIATGKAVWCEFPLGRHGQCLKSDRASAMLAAYRTLPGVLATSGGVGLPAADESPTDLIGDLLHWVAARGGDPDAVLDRAQMHYEAEAT
ncbi:ATP-binding protein [Streptomyces sp. NBC_00872]|uniref:ATP-binding protein n=1 Tax=Streptomyces sp. NBC_00872 TaxID=2903686 RepID=UPI003867562C|nr:ATP-binding protein [Streptomyces sp. NBC_00872]